MIGTNFKCKEEQLKKFSEQQKKHTPWGVDLSKLNDYFNGAPQKNVVLDETFLEQFIIKQ